MCVKQKPNGGAEIIGLVLMEERLNHGEIYPVVPPHAGSAGHRRVNGV